ncbi:MAG: hypothetical protein F4X64_07840 [Chloroflexi bacterium]|nr:hypothetical protein [Chloroflexota bacterium]
MPRPRRNRDAALPGNGGREVIREEAVNTFLAQLLRDQGIAARAERRNRNATPDVRIILKTGDTVLLECKWEDSVSQLQSQLDTRLRQFPDALGVIGVLYPEGLKYLDDTREGLEHAGDLEWWLHGSRGESITDRRSRFGSPADIADHLRVLPLELEGTDRVVAAAAVIEHAVEQSAQKLATHARTARRVRDVVAQTDQESDRAKALRIGCLVVFNALAFHLRLAATHEDVAGVPEAYRDGIPGLFRAWQYICDNIDYVPVFDLAATILDILSDAPTDWHAPVLDPLLKAIDDTRHLEGHDLSGRLFHTLLTDAKFTGAYYTSVPAATLLTRLVFHDWPAGVDWSDHEFPASLNVADIACGTGTLLMVVAAEAERRHTEAGGRNAPALHKAMVEQALHGYDVQLSAVHFAATSLAMLNPDIQFDRINLYVMPLGADGDDVSLGSLDFLGESQAAVQFALSPAGMGVSGRTIRDAGRVYGGGSRGAAEEELATLPDLDLAIMNPPFTRSVGGNLLFGSLPAADRRKLQDELSRRLKSRQATATAGLGAAFVAAASPKLRPGEGRLALVLPATVCTGPSWQQTRSLIERDFTLDTVIVSHDPQRWNFSDSTDLSEALLIATRRGSVNGTGDALEHRTTFVSLWQNPDGVLDAHRAAQAIADTTPANLEDAGTALVTVDGRHVGELVSIPESRLMGRKWAGVQFARADLTRSAMRLLDDGEVWVPGESATGQIPLCPLAQLGEIGPDRRRLVDGFERTAVQTAYPMVEGHDTEQRKSIVCAPDAYLSPLVTPRGGQRPGYGEHLWQQGGRLLIAERLWLETNRVIAMRTDVRVLSNVWWPVKIDEVSHEKALAVWLNSSLGLLTLLAQRTSTRGGWVGMKKADLEQLPTLDVRALTPQQLQALSQLFDNAAADEFQRLPAMADCPTRRRLDNGLSDILGLPDLDGLRRLLASEPVVTNRRL